MMNPSHAGAEKVSPHDQEDDDDDDGESATGARLVLRAERTARDLLSEWRRHDQQQEEKGGATTSIHIDALQLYRLGGLLVVQLRDRAHQQTKGRHARSAPSLPEAAHGLVAAMSAGNRSDAFRHLHFGLHQLVRICQGGANESSVEPSELTEDERNVEEAIRVLSELYAVAGEYGPTAADVRNWGGAETSACIHERVEGDPALHPLLSLYANVIVPHKRKRASEAIMKILTRLVWTDRPNVDDADNDDAMDGNRNDTALFSVLRTIQAFDAAWCDFVRHQEVRDENWREALVRHHQDADNLDDDQLAYLSSILHAPTSDDADNRDHRLSLRAPPAAASSAAAAIAAPTQAPRAAHESELDRRIRQVRQVLPDLGEGFVEAVLSYYQGDVERTVTSLLQEEADGSSHDGSTGDGLPDALRSLDWSLPRRARRRRSDSRPDLDEDVIAITKSIVRETDRLHEEEAYALERVGVDDDYGVNEDHAQRAVRDEYDDDYDDQYDDYQPSVDDKAGASDDYEAVRLYNRALKSVVREQAYWEEERNTNRPQRAKPSGGGGRTSDDDNAEDAGPSQYRGPDKLRGGRVPREHRGGGGGARGRGSAPGRAAGGGGGGQPTGGRGRGRGGGQRDTQVGRASATSSPNNAAAAPDSGAPSQPGRGSRAKANRLSNRRDKQKQAAAKRVG
jgi:CUE domain